MPKNLPEEFPLTWNQVAAWRVSQHHLLGRLPAAALAAVAGDMAGVQAQLLSAAQISLWTRVHNLQVTEFEKALNDHLLVKAACMRQTQFLVPSEQLSVFVRGSARRAEKAIRWTRGKGVSDRTIEAAIEAVLNVLDQPRTRPEIAEQVCRILGVQAQIINGGIGWGSRRQVDAVPIGDINFPIVFLLQLVAARGVVCSGPNRGNEPTFVRAGAWITGWQDMPREQAEVSLLRKYLSAFGPATAADFALWSGMTLTEAHLIWTQVQDDLAAVNIEGWSAEVLRNDLDELEQAKFERPLVRLLPYFDTFLLGHKNRDHLVTREYQPQIYRPQGWIAPVVLENGRPIATWKHTRKGKNLQVKITKFGSISSGVMTQVQEEVQDLSRFLEATSADIQVG